MSNKIIIAGSRGFTDYLELVRILDTIFAETDWQPSEIISGHAKGVDQMAERYAQEHGIACITMPADWDKHGKSAGYRRNADMLAIADRLVAIWDGESSGTKHMMDIAVKKGIPSKIVTPKNTANRPIPGYFIAIDRTIKPCEIISQPNQGQVLCKTDAGKFFVKVEDTSSDLSAITARLHALLSMHFTAQAVIDSRNIKFCPACHGALVQDRVETKFCHRCGQAVYF